jgi:hypothetical protein
MNKFHAILKWHVFLEFNTMELSVGLNMKLI